ncbi:MAG TPA: glycoside hydrolase family 2 TIM barrel-domain containing protein [Halanaerobiales bacterium]|nr:glycoside hydrolase family 2 TIM barrel-domain containing protein [Halanaerobiales bacterium]
MVGACSFARSEERRVELLKKARFNFIRTAHNTAPKSLLKACDRNGMLVIDESFDMWNYSKTPYDYARDFANSWKKDVDKSHADTDLSHDLVVREKGIKAKYIKLTVKELPFDQKPAVSGLRVFGKGNGNSPQKAERVSAYHTGSLNVKVKWNDVNAVGYNVLWGHKKDKLYHSHMVFDQRKLDIRAVVKNEKYFLRVDTFNENGITKGEVSEVKE